MLYDVIIIGSGPAGVSSALYAKRANLNVLVISKNQGNLLKADKIENYYGIESISGEVLINNGLKQLERLNVELVDDQVVGIEWMGDYNVLTKDKTYNSKTVIIATGNSRKVPNIKNLRQLEGMGVSYCATCDGFFYRQKDVIVIGNGEYAYHEASALKDMGVKVSIYTNGLEPEFKERDIDINTSIIEEIIGDNKVEAVKTSEGIKSISGVFVALGIAGSFDFARKLGAEVANNAIVVNENMECNIPGLYAAGDTTGGLLQVAKAVYEGAKAATSVINFVRKK